MIGFRLDLNLEFLLAQPTRQNDLLGDHCRRRQRHRNVLGSCSALLDGTPHRPGHFVEVFDVPIGDPATLQWLHRATLQRELP